MSISVAGNRQLLADLQQMRRGGHLPHALFLHGEPGCGKKTIARWFTQLVLCEHPEQAPCGCCKSCRLAEENTHPDITLAAHSGKRGGISIETAREIRRDAAVLPNNGSMRLFLFTDADEMTVQAQNALLKSVEEPPAHACFVFTAGAVGVLLPTLLSRMTVKAVYPVTREECTEALLARGFDPADVRTAVARFGGNIGKCIAYLEDDSLRRAADCAAGLTRALADLNEYELLRLLTDAAADKDALRRTLSLLDAQLRDAAVLAMDSALPVSGCDISAAEALAKRLSPRRTMRIHTAIAEAQADLDGNVGAVLTVTALCAALMEA